MRKHNTLTAMLGFQEVKDISLGKAILAEFIGTLFLVFIGCGASSRDGINWLMNAALASGITLATMIHALGHISGSHINPAVSFGFLCARYISLTRFLAFTIAQIAGSLTGIGILRSMLPATSAVGLGVVTKNANITDAQAFGMEVVLVFALLFVIMSSVDERRTDIQGSPALAIGLTLVALILVGGNWSGAGINPARVMGPLIVSGGDWTYHWVYWAGPFLGAAMGTLTYCYLFRELKNIQSESTQNIVSDRY